MTIFNDCEPYFVDRKLRERLRTRKVDVELAEELQDIKQRIHAWKCKRRENEMLKDFLAAETDREWQAEQEAAQ